MVVKETCTRCLDHTGNLVTGYVWHQGVRKSLAHISSAWFKNKHWCSVSQYNQVVQVKLVTPKAASDLEYECMASLWRVWHAWLNLIPLGPYSSSSCSMQYVPSRHNPLSRRLNWKVGRPEVCRENIFIKWCCVSLHLMIGVINQDESSSHQESAVAWSCHGNYSWSSLATLCLKW